MVDIDLLKYISKRLNEAGSKNYLNIAFDQHNLRNKYSNSSDVKQLNLTFGLFEEADNLTKLLMVSYNYFLNQVCLLSCSITKNKN